VKRTRWWIAALAIVVAAGLWRLRFDADVLNLLPTDLPAVAGLKLYQENFANNREVVVTVESESSAETEAAAKALAEKIRQKLGAGAVWRPPWLDQSDATAEFLAWLWLSRPPEEVAAMRERLNATNAPAALNDARERLATSLSPLDLARLSHDPFGLTQLGQGDAALMNQGDDWFASKDGTFRLVFVQPAQALKGYGPWGDWLASLRAVMEEISKTNQVKIGMTGTPVFTVEAAQAMKGDMTQSIWMTLLMVGGLFWWAHRRFRPLGWVLLMLVSSLLITMSVGGLVFGALNVVSFGFAAILLGLGIDYSLVLYQELIDSPDSSAREIREHAAAGIWWSAGTTALAFALLNFAGLPGLGQLGTLVAVGIMVAATAMLYGFLPMMTRRPPKPRQLPARAAPLANVNRAAWIATAALLALGAIVLSRAWPGIDHSAQPLGTINTEA
jgi:predicted exporter